MNMHRMKYLPGFIFSLFMMMGMSSCETDLKLPDTGERKIVLLGELVADDSIYFRGGQSTPLKNGTKLNFDLLQDMKVTVDDRSGTAVTMNGKEDDLASWLSTLVYAHGNKIQPGKTYEVRAEHPSLATAKAEVSVPPPFAAMVTDTATVPFLGMPCVRFRIRINDLPAAGDFYAIEAVQQQYIQQQYFLYNNQWLLLQDHFALYDSLQQEGIPVDEKMEDTYLRSLLRLRFYTTDAMSEHLLSGNVNIPANRLLLKDNSFNGGTHDAEIFIPRESIFSGGPGVGFNTIIQVKSVSAGYFRYLQAYEAYDPFSGSNMTTPSRIPGNITNGVGIIGGVYRHQFRYAFFD